MEAWQHNLEVLLGVLDEIIFVLPPEQDKFRQVLTSHRESVACTSPETVHLRWEAALATLESYLPKLDKGIKWQKIVLDKWMVATRKIRI